MDTQEAGKLGVAAVTLIAAEAGLAHFGAPGVLTGLAASWAAYHYSDRFVARLAEKNPSQPKPEKAKKAGKSSFAYRLFNGKSTRNEQESEEDVQEPEYIHLGDDLAPHADTVFSHRIAILGMPGSGKSNLVADFAEELADFDAPFLIFDHKPEYGRMCEFFPNGFVAGAHNVTPERAFEFGQYFIKNRKQVVLDLRSYRNDNAAALVIINSIKGAWAWQEQFSNDDRIPCTFLLDEAHYWFPQSQNLSTVSRKENKEGISLFSELQQAFFNLVNGGRSFGLGTIIATQRPANIDKRVINMAEWKFLFKADMPQDLAVYRVLGADDTTIQNLPRWHAYVGGPEIERGVYQIRERYTPAESDTPGLAALKKPSFPEQQAHHVPFPTSAPTSQASNIPTSLSTSERRSNLYVVPATEVANEAARSGDEVAEVAEAAVTGLSEREMQVVSMFIEKRMNPGAIARELSGGKGGDAFQKASVEVAEAIRKYIEAQMRGA